MHDNAMAQLSEHFGDILSACEDRGMQRPFIVCAASPNGSVLCVRANPDGEEPDVLAEHYDAHMFRLPITVMVLDQTGEAVRITITVKGVAFH